MHLVQALAGAALLVVLGGCGGGQEAVMGSAFGHDPRLEEALLTAEHLGAGFVPDRDADEDDADDDSLGCLGEMGRALEERGEEGGPDQGVAFAQAEIDFVPDTDLGLPLFGELLVRMGRERAGEGLDIVTEEMADCHSVAETDEDGSRLTLSVETDAEQAEGTDRQVNVVASGTITAHGVEVPMLFEMRLAVVDDTLVAVFYGNLVARGDTGERLMQAAVDRFVAVMAGEEPPEPEPLLEGEQPQLPGVPDDEASA